MFGPIGLLSPNFWFGLMFRRVEAMLDTSPIPRPTKLFYRETNEGAVVLHPEVPDPPARLTGVADEGLGLVPGTDRSVLRLPDHAQGVGAILEPAPEGVDFRRLVGGEVIEVPLVFEDQHAVPPVLRAISNGRANGGARDLDVLTPA